MQITDYLTILLIVLVLILNFIEHNDNKGNINITLSPKGTFYLNLQQLNGENYKILKQMHKKLILITNIKILKRR